jgi:predicted ester cyclase
MDETKRLFVIALGIVMVAWSFSLVAQDDMGETHKQTLLRIIEEGFNQGDLDVIDEFFAPDYVNHDPSGAIVDRESFKGFISAFRAAMPDFEANVEMLIVEGDWMSFRFISTGTFENELALFPGLPPTGEPVEFIIHVILRFNEDGQIVEEWDLTDNLTFLTHLSLLPPTEGRTTEIFAIGREDNSYGEFRSNGFSELTEFTCTVGVDCLTEMFPNGLNREHLRLYAHSSVERITIQFSLEQAYNNVVLRLARAGSETTVVTIDGKRTYFVTNEMLGSSEGWTVGVFNLRLGTLEEGVHTSK